MKHRLQWALGVAALALLVWLFRQSMQIDIALHVRTVQHFEQLREQDARLNQFTLQSRYGLLLNYDPLVGAQQAVVEIVAELGRDMPDAFTKGDSPIQRAFSDYLSMIQNKAELVESFKSHNAVLRNSLSYFPIAAKEQQLRFRSETETRALLHDLLESVLLFDQNPTSDQKAHLARVSSGLKRSVARSDPGISTLLRHVDIILVHKEEVDSLARGITQSQTNVQAQKVFALYSEDFELRDKKASHYKLAMALLAASMLGYVGWLLTNLQLAKSRLAGSLRELEFQKSALDRHSIVSITDRTGKILYTNDKFSEVSQFSPEELLGQDHRLLNSGHHPSEFFRAMWATIGRGNVWQGEVMNRRKDGSFYWVDSTVAPFMDEQGKPVRYVSIRTDITKRKQSESDMLKATLDAENAREVAVQARLAAEDASKIKGDFLANMSHEIRTPINGIIGFTNLTLDSDLTPDQRECVGHIKSSADALLNVINDILDFSKIESGKLDIENIEFSLESMLRDTATSLSIRAHEKNLELLVHVASNVPDRVIGDPGRLRQVLINLLGNAIKFTHAGEVILEVMQSGELENNCAPLHFSVRDTGIGIPEDKFKTIFESFSQADTTTTRKYGGTGLGLTISSQIISLMGGNISLSSKVGVGSSFYFTLKLPVVSANPLAAYQKTGRVQGLSVLVVDDNASNRRLLQEMLRSWGMVATVCASGETALNEFQRAVAAGTPYALMLLDVQMPGMDGFELANRLVKNSGKTPPTVMMLTSQGQRGDAARCQEMGIASYLNKPVAQSDLFDAIMSALGEPQGPTPSLITQHSLRESRRKMQLLLAEDNAVNQKLATRLLERLGHQVTLARNGFEALQCWKNGLFDAILMDVDMPEMNGYEATQRIRSEELAAGTHIPIIAMTAHAMKGAREECLLHGMDGYLSKPINVDALWNELDGIGQQFGSEGAQQNVQFIVADFAKARAMMDGDSQLFTEIVKQYLADAPVQLKQLQVALDAHDEKTARRCAHTIQGMASAFSAERTTHFAHQVEQNVGTITCLESLEELNVAMAELQLALEQLTDAS